MINAHLSPPITCTITTFVLHTINFGQFIEYRCYIIDPQQRNIVLKKLGRYIQVQCLFIITPFCILFSIFYPSTILGQETLFLFAFVVSTFFLDRLNVFDAIDRVSHLI